MYARQVLSKRFRRTPSFLVTSSSSPPPTLDLQLARAFTLAALACVFADMREVQVPSFSPDPHAALEVVKLSQAQHDKPFYFLHMMQSITKERLSLQKMDSGLWDTRRVSLVRRAI